ncbi:uncharacterized protein Z520_09132 [Fonsecaea multimorphosa CBS 102226]|uniref:Formamidopyrimidine-DNA glycosylase catalytic domain-containing protein n=1 Tax=Fonsecaea multimorphosa CBS 102226 TaxID=1442371 RepID=A0A0D2IDK1_9EURO|nr:uncharacterized protein Z520_09132 [Fonsecaea multimorphosa CBS 102226]KIX95216.1 hypothetical protein Z520_09132 [Fonsecaea multimorphosa CBS 102226]OAL17290.1 hypothetical protein AYO22_11856 [Fonsecaea multimorphosa]
MPEIAEVARIVHYIRKLLVGKTIAKVTATDDASVYGKVGTSAAEFEKHMAGKKIVDAGQQGKYFWMIMSSAPHPVMHFGMSGWLKFKSEHTYYYQPQEGKKDETWPPKFMKFMLETEEKDGEEAIEAAFVDMRRFARVRLVDCPGDEIRQHSPLVENGPDPVIDKDVVTVEWLREKCKSKKVPIKAMLLDQANISGIGNWVGDEIMYNAKMHPEQYANTLNDSQIAQLHRSIHYICGTAVELLADSEKFPEDWLFKHRWGKGKKDSSNTLPNGEKIAFLTVGGRTSAVVPSVQKKTGPVAKEMSEAEMPDEEDAAKKPKDRKRKSAKEDQDDEVEPKKSKAKKRKSAIKEEEDDDDDQEEEEEVMPKKPNGRKSKAANEDQVDGVEPRKSGGRKLRSTPKKEEERPTMTTTMRTRKKR